MKTVKLRRVMCIMLSILMCCSFVLPDLSFTNTWAAEISDISTSHTKKAIQELNEQVYVSNSIEIKYNLPVSYVEVSDKSIAEASISEDSHTVTITGLKVGKTEIVISNNRGDGEKILLTVIEKLGGSVRATLNDLSMQEDDELELTVHGDAGDTILVYFFYIDENGDNASVIIGGLGGTVLDSDGNKTVTFKAPNDIDSLDVKVEYELSKPTLDATVNYKYTPKSASTTTSTNYLTTTSTTTASTTTVYDNDIKESFKIKLTPFANKLYEMEADIKSVVSTDKSIAACIVSDDKRYLNITAANYGYTEITVELVNGDKYLVELTVSDYEPIIETSPPLSSDYQPATAPPGTTTTVVKPFVRNIASGECGDDVAWFLNEDGCLLISGTGPMKDYSSDSATPWENLRDQIISIYIHNKVTYIGQWAFGNCPSLESITIGDGVESIGYNAFDGKSKLKELNIGSSLKSLKNLPFTSNHQNSLSEINVSDRNPYFSSVSGILFSKEKDTLYRFPINKTWTSYSIPDTVVNIADQAFYGCEHLTSVIIPHSVKSIGELAFSYCSNITSLTIPGSVSEIKRSFTYCKNLSSLTIEEGVKTIDSNAFMDSCYVLDSVVFPSSVESVGFYALGNTSSIDVISSITFLNPDCTIAPLFYMDYGQEHSLTSGNTTLYGYSNSTAETYAKKNGYMFVVLDTETPVTTTSTSTTTTTTAKSTTTSTSKTTTATTKATTTSTSKTTTATTKATTTSTSTTTTTTSTSSTVLSTTVTTIITRSGQLGDNMYWNYDGKGTITISGSGNTWRLTISNGFFPAWDEEGFADDITNIVIQDGVTNLGYPIFANCSNLENVEIPDSLENFALSCPKDSPFMKNAETINGVKYLGDWAIACDDSLSELVLKDGIKRIAIGAFFDQKFNKAFIPDSVEYIGASAFNGCVNLQSISSPDFIDFIGPNAFDGTPLQAENDIIYVGGWAVRSSRTIENAIIKPGTKALITGLFDYREELSEVVLPDSLTYIGDLAFSGSGITSIQIPESVTACGGSVFNSCLKLKSVSLSSGLKEITYTNEMMSYINGFFSGCSELEEITIPDGLETIDAASFYFCSKLKKVVLPNSIKRIGGGAFAGCKELKTISIPRNVAVIEDFALGYTDVFGPDPVKTEGFTIQGYKGSEAERYAIANDIPFIAIDNAIESTTPTTKPTTTSSSTTTTTTTTTTIPTTTADTINTTLVVKFDSDKDSWSFKNDRRNFVEEGKLKITTNEENKLEELKKLLNKPTMNKLIDENIINASGACFGMGVLDMICLSDRERFIPLIQDNAESIRSIQLNDDVRSKINFLSLMQLLPEIRYSISRSLMNENDAVRLKRLLSELDNGPALVCYRRSLDYEGTPYAHAVVAYEAVPYIVSDNDDTEFFDSLNYEEGKDELIMVKVYDPRYIDYDESCNIFINTKNKGQKDEKIYWNIKLNYKYNTIISNKSILYVTADTSLLQDLLFTDDINAVKLNKDIKVYPELSLYINSDEVEEKKYSILRNNGPSGWIGSDGDKAEYVSFPMFYGESDQITERILLDIPEEEYKFKFDDGSSNDTSLEICYSKALFTIDCPSLKSARFSPDTISLTTGKLSEYHISVIRDDVTKQNEFYDIYISGRSSGEITLKFTDDHWILSSDEELGTFTINASNNSSDSTTTVTRHVKGVLIQYAAPTSTNRSKIGIYDIPDATYEDIDNNTSTTVGDVNNDNLIDASDASLILTDYAQTSTGQASVFEKEQEKVADVNEDGMIDASDTSLVLSYYAYISTHSDYKGSLKEYILELSRNVQSEKTQNLG